MDRLEATARGDGNLMPPILDGGPGLRDGRRDQRPPAGRLGRAPRADHGLTTQRRGARVAIASGASARSPCAIPRTSCAVTRPRTGRGTASRELDVRLGCIGRSRRPSGARMALERGRRTALAGPSATRRSERDGSSGSGRARLSRLGERRPDRGERSATGGVGVSSSGTAVARPRTAPRRRRRPARWTAIGTLRPHDDRRVGRTPLTGPADRGARRSAADGQRWSRAGSPPVAVRRATVRPPSTSTSSLVPGAARTGASRRPRPRWRRAGPSADSVMRQVRDDLVERAAVRWMVREARRPGPRSAAANGPAGSGAR